MGACSSAVDCASRGGDWQAPGLILGRYQIHADKRGVLGEGTSSVCHRGIDTKTGVPVAIKIYKDQCHQKESARNVLLRKFRRQIEVMEELQQPFVQPADPALGGSWLAVTSPQELFVRLLDYSTGLDGKPGPDVCDGCLYTVMELAQQDLKNYLESHRRKGKALEVENVHSLSKDIVKILAGLHAKGFVHLDLKPENIMMCGPHLKLIDVDSCTRVGERLSVHDSSISFSPIYCAPEWARFVIDRERKPISVDPGLDVWSVGMTLCELVMVQPCLKAAYVNKQSRHGYYEWLGALQSAPLPKDIDADFADLLSSCMLVGNRQARKTLAQCLSHPFFDEPVSRAQSAVRDSKDSVEREPHACKDAAGESDGSTTASSRSCP